MVHPVVTELFLRPLMFSRNESVAEEVTVTVILEDAELRHQPRHLVGHRNGHRVVVLRLVTHQCDGASTNVNIAHTHTREFLGADAHIVRQVASQQVVPVVVFQIVTYLSKYVIRYHSPLLHISTDLHVMQTGTRILCQISALRQIGREGAQPTEIVVTRDKRVVTLDVHIVEKLTDDKAVQLVHISNITAFFHPLPEMFR